MHLVDLEGLLANLANALLPNGCYAPIPFSRGSRRNGKWFNYFSPIVRASQTSICRLEGQRFSSTTALSRNNNLLCSDRPPNVCN